MSGSAQLLQDHADQMHDHWWWRPGWEIGKRFYTWHFTFADQTALHPLVDAYQHAIAPAGGFDLIPHEWLHLTTQGVGFTHEVDDELVDQVVAAATTKLAEISVPQLTFHRAVVLPEAVALPPVPVEPLGRIRSALRDAIGEVVGPDNVPEQADRFRPHVSVAYNHADRPGAGVVQLVDQVDHPPVTVTLPAASLIVIGRDEHLYRWRTHARVALGPLHA